MDFLFTFVLSQYVNKNMQIYWQRNWVFATNSDFIINISLEPNVADLRYFKLWILLDQIIWVWNIKGLRHRVLKILRFKYLILFQWLNSFVWKMLPLNSWVYPSPLCSLLRIGRILCFLYNRFKSRNNSPTLKWNYFAITFLATLLTIILTDLYFFP